MCDPNKSCCIKGENGHAQCTLMKGMVISHYVWAIDRCYWVFVGLVGCGLTSHASICQLYSDATVVQFPNFDLLPDTQRHGQLRVFSVPSLPRHGHLDARRRLKPSCHQRSHTQWGYAGNRTRICRSTVQSATSAPPRRAIVF